MFDELGEGMPRHEVAPSTGADTSQVIQGRFATSADARRAVSEAIFNDETPDFSARSQRREDPKSLFHPVIEELERR